MTVKFKPHHTTGEYASQWLMSSGNLGSEKQGSGILSKAEQLLLDSWMTRKSRDIRNLIARECIRLEEMGVLKDIPDLRIIPQIETIAEAGHRKFLVWTDKVTKAIPDFVLSGFRSLTGVNISANSEKDPFEDVTRENNKPYATGLHYHSKRIEHNRYDWKHPELSAAIILLGTPDFKDSFDASFPGLEEAMMFALHHEIAHASLLVRQTFNPIVAPVNILTPYTDDADREANSTWENEAWAALFSIQVPKQPLFDADLHEFQTLWSEYYADVGAALMHARAGYGTQYIEPLCQARASGPMNHQTQPVLRALVPIMDFHPIVLNKKSDYFDLHMAIGSAIAPQIGLDILNIIQLSPMLARSLEGAFPDLGQNSQIESQGYAEMNDAMGGQFPKMAMFFAKMQAGPDATQVATAFERVRSFEIAEGLRQDPNNQITPSLSMT